MANMFLVSARLCEVLTGLSDAKWVVREREPKDWLLWCCEGCSSFSTVLQKLHMAPEQKVDGPSSTWFPGFFSRVKPN